MEKDKNVTYQTVDGGYLWGGGCEKDLFSCVLFVFFKTKTMGASVKKKMKKMKRKSKSSHPHQTSILKMKNEKEKKRFALMYEVYSYLSLLE